MTEPIAITGIGCRFPGGAVDPASFWRLLRSGGDAVTAVPPERWRLEDFLCDDDAARGKTYSGAGGFLAEIDRFDAAFFDIGPAQAAAMDPQQRLLLEVSWEALESAGEPAERLAGSSTGIFVGMLDNEYERLAARARDRALEPHLVTGNLFSMASGRLSYFYGTHGPSLTVNTACSSSLVAVHLACTSLAAGECERALAAGVNLLLRPESYVHLAKMRALSRRGRCSTFDESADGFVRAEGCGVLVLKRLADAVRERDRIFAVIRGSAVNQDGRRPSVATPNAGAQRALIEAALRRAGAAPGEVSYVEAHGTGTPLGDPIEAMAIADALAAERAADDPLWIGSVKTNIGHAESAAGMAGLIKTVLALRHRQIPPHLHLRRLNPRIALGDRPVRFPGALVDWTSRRARRLAGVSSFGLGGTNAHVLVEEAPEPTPAGSAAAPRLLVLSAKEEPSLRALAERHAAALASSEDSLADLCFTACTGRSPLELRLAVAGDSRGELARQLSAFCAGQPGPGLAQGRVKTARGQVAFLFSGGGTQSLGMGRGLYRSLPAFRDTLDRCTDALGEMLPVPLRDAIFAEGAEAAARLDRSTFMYPAIVAVELALFESWTAWGVRPAMVMGHSLGEYAAAVAAGVLSVEDGMRLVATRGRLVDTLPPVGAAFSILADEASARRALEPVRAWVGIAAINGPRSTVISGRVAELEQVVAGLQAEGIKCKPLRVSHAHSPLLEPILGPLEAFAATLEHGAPRLPIVSNLLATAVDQRGVIGPGYWRRHMREPVRFAEGMKVLFEARVRHFVEVGPSATLVAMGQLCLPEDAVWAAETSWGASLQEGRDDRQQMLESLGRLFTRGWPLDWAALDPEAAERRRVELPRYPFRRTRHWVDAPPEAAVAAPVEARSATLVEEWRAAPVGGGPAVVARFAGAAVRQVLGLEAGRPLEPDADLALLGMDSLRAIELVHVLQRGLGDAVKLPTALPFERPTLEGLSAAVHERLLGVPGGERAPASNRWVRFRAGHPEARVRLLCLHYAGGSAQAFLPWLERRPPWLELGLVQLPGRWERLAEPPFTSVPALVDALLDGLRPLLLEDRPYALLGYSVGAIVAYELARAIAARGLPEPRHLFACAAAAPHRPRPTGDAPIAGLPDAELVAALARLYGRASSELLARPGAEQAVLAALRADLALSEEYRHRDGPTLEVPIAACGGRDDALVPAAELDLWRLHTRRRFEARLFEGDHFFLHAPAGLELLRSVVNTLEAPC